MNCFYNEIDPGKAEWLRQLMAHGLIQKGIVDERSIEVIKPEELDGYIRCGFFAGIGIWDYALQLAGWPDDAEAWHGSAPCQPFSVAGQGKGEEDERHLWPAWFRLIEKRRPKVIFGEQVASAAVIGKADTRAQVQEMLDRESVFRILRELQGTQTEHLQGVYSSGRTSEEAGESRTAQEILFRMERQKEGLRSGECGEVSGQNERHPVQPRSSGHSGENRERDMRTNGNQVHTTGNPGMERPVSGSDKSRKGIHSGEREDCPFCSQRNVEHMGTGSSGSGCFCDYVSAPAEVERVINSTGSEIKACRETTWLDVIQLQLEGIGYNFRTCVLPACSLGAPHGRHRTFFVADTNEGRRKQCDAKQRSISVAHSNGSHGILVHDEQAGLEGHRRDGVDRNQPGWNGTGPNGSTWSPSAVNGFWADAEWVPCRGEIPGAVEWRPIKPESQPMDDGSASDLLRLCNYGFPLVKGAEARALRLKGYGDGLVLQVAVEFIRAYLEVRGI